MTKILIVEDEENIRELIAYNLVSEGYELVIAEDGKSGLAAANEENPDLILLDIMLPALDGYGVIRALREAGNPVPVIMLTAKNDEVDKVLGLEFGADDYITKPFGVRELKARIRAVLRRCEIEGAGLDAKANAADDFEGKASANGAESATGDSALVIGDLRIDIPGREVAVNGRPVALTLKEFELLKTLAENRGIVLTRDRLLDKVWGYDYAGETRTVDVHVRYLRRKLGGGEDRYISTVRGVGYKMK
ncbi:MAG: response regulator transcription factor [Clostridiales Family XIII bacterium]|jgi:two-component system alkaline phosphatase synthesis response regulator PhoP|nr:response regulator transcription factor [Clostridiales Family XIII bacterium]